MDNRRPQGKALTSGKQSTQNRAAKGINRRNLLTNIKKAESKQIKVYKNTQTSRILKLIFSILESKGKSLIGNNLVETLENFDETSPWGK